MWASMRARSGESRPEREVAFEVLERLLDRDQQD